MKAIKPFPSFSMLLPDSVAEDHKDTNVSSYGMTGDSCLLQVSCLTRDSGPQISATERLSDRLKRAESGSLSNSLVRLRVAKLPLRERLTMREPHGSMRT
jgi:hypothetical protein